MLDAPPPSRYIALVPRSVEMPMSAAFDFVICPAMPSPLPDERHRQAFTPGGVGVPEDGVLALAAMAWEVLLANSSAWTDFLNTPELLRIRRIAWPAKTRCDLQDGALCVRAGEGAKTVYLLPRPDGQVLLRSGQEERPLTMNWKTYADALRDGSTVESPDLYRHLFQ